MAFFLIPTAPLPEDRQPPVPESSRTSPEPAATAYAARGIAVLAGVFAVVWCVAQFRTARTEGEWRDDWRARAQDEYAGALAWLDRADRPLDANLELGGMLDKAFPPKHARAEELYAESLPSDPGSPVLWYRLAHSRAYQGNLDGARAALERSDEIVPLYPRQRYGAIHLWALLGEPERAVRIARQIGGLGTEFRARAARDLLGIGLTSVEVFTELECASLPPADQIRIVRALSPMPPDELTEVMELVAVDSISDPALLNDALGMALEPQLVPETALRLWRAASPHMERTSGPVYIENPKLQAPPFASAFALGWQAPESSIRARSRWVGPVDTHADAQGFIQIVFPGNAMEKPFTWRFLRLLAEPGPAGTIEIRLRMIPPGSSDCSLMLKSGEELIERVQADAEATGWQSVRFTLPERAEAAILNLGLVREPLAGGNDSRADAELNIGSISWEEDAASE